MPSCLDTSCHTPAFTSVASHLGIRFTSLWDRIFQRFGAIEVVADFLTL